MTGSEYQKLAMRTNDKKGTERLRNQIDVYSHIENNLYVDDGYLSMGGIFNACLGLSGEVGEFNDMIKKWVFHEKELDVEHAKKECGDILWYVSMMCESFGWSMDEIMKMNIDKLKARYPDGFDIEKANNRKEGDI